METEKSKEKQGGKGAKKDKWEEEEDGIQGLCCRPQGAGMAKGIVLPQHGWSGVIHRGKAGHGFPKQQVGQDSPFLASPALSHRVWSPAQTTAAQDVLPPACSLIPFTWGTGKTLPVPLLPRRDGSNCLGLELPCKAKDLSKPGGSIRGGGRGNRKDRENFLWLFIHSVHRER